MAIGFKVVVQKSSLGSLSAFLVSCGAEPMYEGIFFNANAARLYGKALLKKLEDIYGEGEAELVDAT